MKAVTCAHQTLCMSHYEGTYAALQNRCPHQGGPHGWDFHPTTGQSPEGLDDKEQRAGDWEVWQTSLHNPSFAEFARLCGAMGVRVTDERDLDRALSDAMAHEGPALVEVMTDAQLV